MDFIFKKTTIPNRLLANVSRVEEIHIGKCIRIQLFFVMHDKVELLVKGGKDRKLLQDLYTAVNEAKMTVVKAGTRSSYNYTVKHLFIAPKRTRDSDVTVSQSNKRTKLTKE